MAADDISARVTDTTMLAEVRAMLPEAPGLSRRDCGALGRWSHADARS
jgi:hypothetical protein